MVILVSSLNREEAFNVGGATHNQERHFFDLYNVYRVSAVTTPDGAGKSYTCSPYTLSAQLRRQRFYVSN